MLQSTHKVRLPASFLALVACAAVFVWKTSQSLPNVVASHFGASGEANGFMPREYYVWFMLGIVVISPLALVFLPNKTFRNPYARINLPNREYWLSPERKVETIELLSRQSVRFATMLIIFLCYAHWLVVRANVMALPSFDTQWFLGGLIVFLISTLVWMVLLLRHFLHIPR